MSLREQKINKMMKKRNLTKNKKKEKSNIKIKSNHYKKKPINIKIIIYSGPKKFLKNLMLFLLKMIKKLKIFLIKKFTIDKNFKQCVQI